MTSPQRRKLEVFCSQDGQDNDERKSIDSDQEDDDDLETKISKIWGSPLISHFGESVRYKQLPLGGYCEISQEEYDELKQAKLPKSTNTTLRKRLLHS